MTTLGPVERAAVLGHAVVWDEPHALSRGGRWTCPCGAVVLQYGANVYGSAVEKPCQGEVRPVIRSTVHDDILDLHDDLRARWVPGENQIRDARAVLDRCSSVRSPRWGSASEYVWTLHILTDKSYGFWNRAVKVVPLDGVFRTREAAFTYLGAVVAEHDGPCTGGYTIHSVGADGSDQWAVFEDICSVKTDEGSEA